jgi:acyl-CoA thioester hydrolase
MVYSRFETELQVRPDDIDMNRHAHASRYIDFVLAARFEQMERCYGMSMADFLALNYGWVVKSAELHYKRPLVMGERMAVRTWVIGFQETTVAVGFEILKAENRKVACHGSFEYTLVNASTGRAEVIPASVIANYSI